MFMFYGSDYTIDSETEEEREEFEKIIQQIVRGFSDSCAKMEVIKNLQSDSLVNEISLKKKAALKISISSWSAVEDEVEDTVKAIIRSSQK